MLILTKLKSKTKRYKLHKKTITKASKNNLAKQVKE